MTMALNSMIKLKIAYVSAVLCPQFSLNYATVDIGSMIYGGVAVITCFIGYHFSDETRLRTLVCLDNGEWHLSVEDCVRKFYFYSINRFEMKLELFLVKNNF